MRRKKLITVIYLTVFILAIVTTALVFSLKALSIKKSGIICNGITVDGIQLGGKTVKEARQMLATYIKKIQHKNIVASISENGNKEGTEVISFKELGVSAKIDGVISEISKIGEEGNIIERYIAVKEAEKIKPSYKLDFTYNEKKIDEFVNGIAEKYKISPEDAALTRISGKFIVTGGKNGRNLKKKAAINDTKEKVKESIAKLPDTASDSIEMEYTLVTKKPKYDKDALVLVKDLLGTYSTHYENKGGRGLNIETGCKHINGSLLLPGETLSANQKMAPYTYANGYGLGGAFANGKVVQDMGGGICQVSSTLYNAVLFAELEVIQRQNHSLRVAYIPLSRDAAIAGTWKDLVFKNSSDYPIYVEGILNNGTITFNIYGHEIRSPERKIDYKTVIVSSDMNGIRAQLFKEVYVNGVLKENYRVNSSFYNIADYEREAIKRKAEEEKKEEEEKEKKDGEKSSKDKKKNPSKKKEGE